MLVKNLGAKTFLPVLKNKISLKRHKNKSDSTENKKDVWVFKLHAFSDVW